MEAQSNESDLTERTNSQLGEQFGVPGSMDVHMKKTSDHVSDGRGSSTEMEAGGIQLLMTHSHKNPHAFNHKTMKDIFAHLPLPVLLF